jgi:hypothetical protein
VMTDVAVVTCTRHLHNFHIYGKHKGWKGIRREMGRDVNNMDKGFSGEFSVGSFHGCNAIGPSTFVE